MLAKSEHSHLPPEVLAIARVFRLFGWIGFWGQLGLAFVAVLVLLGAASGRNFSPDSGAGIGVGIFWAMCSLIVLAVAIVIAYRYTRVAKGLLHISEVHWHPKKADTIKLLRLGIAVGFLGMLLAIIGAGASVGVLLAKTVSQPAGVAIIDPNRIIRAMDVFIVLANLNIITAHFVGTTTSIWLWDRIHHH
jgi:hypothetical protein